LPLILEGLVTTLDAGGAMHVAPMGPHVDREIYRFSLRPFPSSRTLDNLRRHGEGVLHVTDDVLLLARAAIGTVDPPPPHRPAKHVRGYVLTGACRAFEFQVRAMDDSERRIKIECEVVHAQTLRDFFGLNRAKHAVVEAAILATRLHLLPLEGVRAELARLRVLVDKTGGDQEHGAFTLLSEFVERAAASPPSD
jgi:hypothetical protein